MPKENPTLALTTKHDTLKALQLFAPELWGYILSLKNGNERILSFRYEYDRTSDDIKKISEIALKTMQNKDLLHLDHPETKRGSILRRISKHEFRGMKIASVGEGSDYSEDGKSWIPRIARRLATVADVWAIDNGKNAATIPNVYHHIQSEITLKNERGNSIVQAFRTNGFSDKFDFIYTRYLMGSPAQKINFFTAIAVSPGITGEYLRTPSELKFLKRTIPRYQKLLHAAATELLTETGVLMYIDGTGQDAIYIKRGEELIEAFK